MTRCKLCNKPSEYRICPTCAVEFSQTDEEATNHYWDCPLHWNRHESLQCVCSAVSTHHYA